MNTYQYQSKNTQKTFILVMVMIALVSMLGGFLSFYTNNYIYIIIALVSALFQSLFSYYSGESMALASAGGQKISLEDNPQLFNIVEDLARTAGIPMPDVYISPDPSANAFACGTGPGRASVCVNQGLLDILNKHELAAVLAHEIGHIRNRDILIMTVTFAMTIVISSITDLALRSMMWGGRSSSDNEDKLSPFILIIFIIAIIVSPIIMTLISLSISRSREYIADATSVELTRYPEAMISALEKLHASPVPTEHFSSATSHFFIAPPKKDYNQKFSDNWFSTHPSVENRVKALLDQDNRLGR